jgi:RNA polymerase sigma-70 factor (ECF subfamily)
MLYAMTAEERTRRTSSTPSTDDHLLVRQIQKGSQSAFDELVKRYYGSAYNMVAHSVRTHEEREDLIQEIFIKVYKNINKFRFQASFSTWLFRITRNMLIDRSRKKSLIQVSMESEEGVATIGERIEDNRANPEAQSMESDADSALRNALMKLDDDHKQILILREMEGLSYRELTEVLGINMGTVKSRLARAREELKIKLMEIYSG